MGKTPARVPKSLCDLVSEVPYAGDPDSRSPLRSGQTSTSRDPLPVSPSPSQPQCWSVPVSVPVPVGPSPNQPQCQSVPEPVPVPVDRPQLRSESPRETTRRPGVHPILRGGTVSLQGPGTPGYANGTSTSLTTGLVSTGTESGSGVTRQHHPDHPGTIATPGGTGRLRT